MKVPKVLLRIETSRVCGREILLGISKYCQQFGRWRLSQNLPHYFESVVQSDNSDLPENWLADGIIIGSSEIPEIVKLHRIPVIGIDIHNPIVGMPNIMGNNQLIAEMALQHFMDRNFSQLAFCEFAGIGWAVERGVFFSDCAKAKGLDVAKYQIKSLRGRFSWDDEIHAIGAWLNTLPRPLGLLACNDDCARLVIAACQLESISVPGDIAILGVDNDEMVCLPNDPPLSSVALDFEKAGFQAAALLDKLIKGTEESTCQRIIIQPTHVKVRRSTDTFAISDPEVKLALQYINDHTHQNITVPDVVEATGISRRGLEYRFKAALGRSIKKVIRTQRVTEVSTMLIETNQSISKIAYKLGFSDIEHISRYFSSEKGICPSRFRKKYGKM